jgi:GTPase SAR1 family protein
MNPMNSLYIKRICPYCIEEFYPGDCEIVSSLTQNPIEPAPVGAARHFARMSPKRLDGRRYTRELACRKCPHCGKLLPYNIESVDNLSIAVVGDTSSGKSSYIAAFIHQIREMNQTGIRQIRFECLNQDIEEKYIHEYYEPLFIKKRRLDFTPPAIDAIREPLIYELVVRETPEHPAKRINLSIYDASGEDHANQDRMVQFSQYILNASAIIFLADPVAMPKIRDQLPPHLQIDLLTDRRVATVLNSVIRIYERNNKLVPGSRLVSVPVAVALSKSDLLKILRHVSDPQYRFLKNPMYDGSVDLQDLQIVDEEVRNLISEHGDTNLLLATRTLSKSSFFATSSTGYAPNADDTYPNVEPCRCLDPVLWVLYKLHILKARSMPGGWR